MANLLDPYAPQPQTLDPAAAPVDPYSLPVPVAVELPRPVPLAPTGQAPASLPLPPPIAPDIAGAPVPLAPEPQPVAPTGPGQLPALAPITLAEAVRIPDAAQRVTELERLAPTDPLAFEALRAEKQAQQQVAIAAEAQRLREDYQREDRAVRQDIQAERERRRLAEERALGDIQARRAELGAQQGAGLSARQIGVATATALAQGLAAILSKGKYKPDGSQLRTLMDGFARQRADQIAAAQARLAGAQANLDDMRTVSADKVRDYELIRQDMYNTLGTELTTLAGKAQTDSARAEASKAAELVLAEAAAAEAKAKQAAIDRAYELDKRDIELAEGEANIRLKTAQANTAERKALGIGMAKPKPKPEVLYLSDPKLRELAETDPKQANLIAENGVYNPFSGQLLKNPNGSYVVRTGPEGKAIRDIIGKSTEAYNLARDLISLRRAHQYEPEFFNSREGQAMRSKSARLLVILKDAFQTGALDAGSVAVLEKLQGGDPAGFRDVEGSLGTLISDMERGVNIQLRSTVGYQGEPIAYPIPGSAESVKREVESFFPALRSPYDSVSGAVAPASERRAALSSFLEAAKAEFGTKKGVEYAIKELEKVWAENEDIRKKIDKDYKSTPVDNKEKRRAYYLGYQEQIRFMDSLGDEIGRLKRLLKEQEAQDKRRDDAAKQRSEFKVPAGGRI